MALVFLEPLDRARTWAVREERDPSQREEQGEGEGQREAGRPRARRAQARRPQGLGKPADSHLSALASLSDTVSLPPESPFTHL